MIANILICNEFYKISTISTFILIPGNYPIFSNLPGSVTIPTSTTIKTVVFTVSVSDLDSKQKLTTSLTSVYPATGYFSLDTSTGEDNNSCLFVCLFEPTSSNNGMLTTTKNWFQSNTLLQYYIELSLSWYNLWCNNCYIKCHVLWWDVMWCYVMMRCDVMHIMCCNVNHNCEWGVVWCTVMGVDDMWCAFVHSKWCAIVHSSSHVMSCHSFFYETTYTLVVFFLLIFKNSLVNLIATVKFL